MQNFILIVGKSERKQFHIVHFPRNFPPLNSLNLVWLTKIPLKEPKEHGEGIKEGREGWEAGREENTLLQGETGME